MRERVNSPHHLLPHDKPDFERVLTQALNSQEIREALRRTGAAVNAEQLRTCALLASTDIAATAETEYRHFLHIRSQSAPSGTAQPSAGAAMGFQGALVSALIVLTPSVAAVAAAVFLLLGYGLRLGDAESHLADGLVTAGWTAALVAATAAIVGIVGVLVTAARNRSVLYDAPARDEHPEVARARVQWQQALLERGMVPFLHRQLRESRTGDSSRPPAHPAFPRAAGTTQSTSGRPNHSSNRGFTTPGYASPNFSSPDFTGPASTGTE
jgi:hypothetical protein